MPYPMLKTEQPENAFFAPEPNAPRTGGGLLATAPGDTGTGPLPAPVPAPAPPEPEPEPAPPPMLPPPPPAPEVTGLAPGTFTGPNAPGPDVSPFRTATFMMNRFTAPPMARNPAVSLAGGPSFEEWLRRFGVQRGGQRTDYPRSD